MYSNRRPRFNACTFLADATTGSGDFFFLRETSLQCVRKKMIVTFHDTHNKAMVNTINYKLQGSIPVGGTNFFVFFS